MLQPQFTEKAKEYSHGWAGLLSIIPELVQECECWGKFNPLEWRNLLFSQPQFADKCNWTEMKANNYDEYDEDEYDDFEYWKAEYGEDYSEDWRNLLLQHPQLAEYFTDTLWDGLSQKDWDELEAKHPGVFEEKHTLSTLRKLAED